MQCWKEKVSGNVKGFVLPQIPQIKTTEKNADFFNSASVSPFVYPSVWFALSENCDKNKKDFEGRGRF